VGAYTDQEEIEKLKAWWKDYGGALLIGVVLGLVLLFGNKYWQQYKEDQRIAASEIYNQMLQQVQESKPDAARVIGAKLTEEYSRTPYAGLAALLLARLEFEANNAPAAQQQLEWAIAHAVDPTVANTARLRLGRLHIANGQYDAALALTTQASPGFEAEYSELKGDALAAQGKREEARNAYAEAVKQVDPSSPSRRSLEMKLEDVGGSTSPTSDSSTSSSAGGARAP
jgi:predicted negative regulator of RcsB-dependent stress response